MSVNLSSDYPLSDDNVVLTVVIGEAQIGSSVVLLDNKLVKMGIIEDFIVGRGPEIAGKTLSIKTVVSDVNDATNRTSVMYRLQGGMSDQQYGLDATVDEDGASIIYRAVFNLTA